VKRNKGTTKKKYEYRITPQNEPHIHLKRLIHFLSCFWLVINCIVLARLLSEPRKIPLLLLAFVFIVLAFIDQIDDRRGVWAWGRIIIFPILFVAIPVFYIFSYNIYWYLIVIAVQIIISTIIFFIVKKK